MARSKQKKRSNPPPRWLPWAMGAAGAGALGLLIMAIRSGSRGKGIGDGKAHYANGPGAPAMTTGAVTPRPTTRGRVYVENRTLYGPVGDPTPLTDEDMLWLGRAIVGETGGRNEEWGAAVAWALAQNLKLVRRARPITTFTGVTRAYCQPINPKWLDINAEGCRRAPHMCTERHLARRHRYVRMSWDDLPPETQRVVQQFQAGTLPNPVSGAVDWHANHFPGATVEIGGNWFGVGRGRRLA